MMSTMFCSDSKNFANQSVTSERLGSSLPRSLSNKVRTSTSMLQSHPQSVDFAANAYIV